MTRNNAAGEGDRPPDGPAPGAKTPDLPVPAPGETERDRAERAADAERSEGGGGPEGGAGQEPADGAEGGAGATPPPVEPPD
ncbi:hypothetical protein [Streptomyces sp. NPDC001594]|uniref:hypothetical protein n=1 Tax=Streptomyces sp. NPDC001594 TaxID=3364590 RepID=UPI0036B35488